MHHNRINQISRAVLTACLPVVSMAIFNVAGAQNYEEEMVILHPFQWSYNSIAKECTEYLGPAGFDGVQISQPAEHISKKGVWWAVYQPVNFKNFTTMTGNEKELRAMIRTCNDAGVKVFADAVFNQRAGGSGTGLGGSSYQKRTRYADGFTSDDFHPGCRLYDYSSADNVRLCDLNGMPDIKTDSSSTQEKIADYLATLMNMGVHGFRIDAAKHMKYTDIDSIIRKTAKKTGRRPPIYMEVIEGSNEAADIYPDKYTYIENSVVTDFSYVQNIKNVFDSRKFGDALKLKAKYRGNSEVFVNNHDDEYKRCSAGSCSMSTQNNPYYHLAQSWMAVWPEGTVRQIYSGYSFSSHDPAGPVSASRCTGGWLCQHREPIVLNAPRFARATRGKKVTTKGYDSGILWFNRGSKGFYAMNPTGSDVKHTFTVEMPDGDYCDILGAKDPDRDPCGKEVKVRNGRVTLTIPAKSAMAICTDENWCGRRKDPCETDPYGAACLCKDQTVDKNGVCESFCSANPSDEKCFCLLNPDNEECVNPIEKTKGILCYTGTSNSWKFEEMAYSKRTGLWTTEVTLSEDSGQSFKIVDGCDWSAGVIYGKSSTSGKLKVNDSKEGNVPIDLRQGVYELSIRDADMTYEFKDVTPVPEPPVPLAADFTCTVSGSTVEFHNKTAFNPEDDITYLWNFGNGETSSVEEPVVVYDSLGKHLVSLLASSRISEESSRVTRYVEITELTENPKGETLCYSGTDTDWKMEPMIYNSAVGYWMRKVELDGSGSQRFRIISGCSWNEGNVLGGNGTSGVLIKSDSFAHDVVHDPELNGTYRLLVKDNALEYRYNRYPDR
ncbi:alpha-amylase family glycosyl hydrolase [Ruminobacter sp. RM87]|uniref:alpha-amylase family glycosyl hydrolase n=1 Tax=Ruminobacter sp. RM87 TaxID=1200567 RepID=UPI00068FB922|nr:alpha-amylase family glycosyl hydrolase [Ruminobacter sp. RM87]